MKVLALILFLSFNAYGAIKTETPIKKEVSKATLKKRKAGLTSRITHKRLERALRYSKNKDNKKAVATLIKLLKQTKNRKYEYAIVWQNLGFMLAGMGENKKAIKALENSLKLNTLPYQQTLSSLFTVAQLYFADENFGKAKEKMKLWFSYADKPKGQAYMLMGMILGQGGEKEKALDYVNIAINSEKKPSEKWLQYALSLNHSLKKYKNALKLLVTLTSDYPENPRYWKQFYQTYLSLMQDDKALAVMDMAYKKGFLTGESEIINMVSLMVYLKMPYKAANIMVNEMSLGHVKENQKNFELLSQAWYQAKENQKAIQALDQAGSLSIDGNLLAKKGYILLETDDWSEAINSFKRSLAKGKLEDKSKVYFGLGLAYFNQDNLSLALDALNNAKSLDSDNKAIATWIEQIKDKKMALNEKEIKTSI